MTALKANEIKIGILSDVKRQIVKKNKNVDVNIKIEKDLRGILFIEQQENIGSDILYPVHKYPILGKTSIYTPTLGITKSEQLGPLLEYYGLNEFSYDELQVFIDEVLLNKKWLKECDRLFWGIIKKYGFISIKYNTSEMKEKLLPESLGQLIYEIHNKKGFCLSRKEQRQYKLK